MGFEHELMDLRARGMTFRECLSAFAESENENPFVSKARERQILGKAEVDNAAPIMREKAGAWVLAWMWVSNHDAGVVTIPELFGSIVGSAATAIGILKSKSATNIEKQRNALFQSYIDWAIRVPDEMLGMLEFDADIDQGGAKRLRFAVGDTVVHTTPSQIFFVLNALALSAGLPLERHLSAQEFLLSRADFIDSILARIATDSVTLPLEEVVEEVS